jgi:SAM-dependent methyltransferase
MEETVLRACAVCGGTAFDVWGRQGEYSILKCGACGLGVTSPFPEAGQAGELNRTTYSGEQRAAVYAVREKELEARYGGYLARIKRFRPAGALLDVGCSIGLFMKAARQEGFAVTGVELNGDCAVYGRGKFGLDIRASALQVAGFPDGAFDIVTLFDVLEHAPEPRGLLAAVNRVLKSGGLLVVQSPNLDSYMARLMKENWRWLTPPDHLYHFTPGAMRRLIEAQGFSVRAVRTWEPASDFSGNIFSGLRARGLAGRVLRKLVWLAGLFLIPLLQRLWWKAGKGGLIEVYAVKTGGKL